MLCNTIFTIKLTFLTNKLYNTISSYYRWVYLSYIIPEVKRCGKITRNRSKRTAAMICAWLMFLSSVSFGETALSIDAATDLNSPEAITEPTQLPADREVTLKRDQTLTGSLEESRQEPYRIRVAAEYDMLKRCLPFRFIRTCMWIFIRGG